MKHEWMRYILTALALGAFAGAAEAVIKDPVVNSPLGVCLAAALILSVLAVAWRPGR